MFCEFREYKNEEFEFLKAGHYLNPYFNHLVESYSKVHDALEIIRYYFYRSCYRLQCRKLREVSSYGLVDWSVWTTYR